MMKRALCCGLCVAITTFSCESNDDPPVAAAAPASADPAIAGDLYGSPEAFVAYFNEITPPSEDYDYLGVADLHYAENAGQELWVEAHRLDGVSAGYYQELLKQFGGPEHEAYTRAKRGRWHHPATLVEHDEERALARYTVISSGKVRELKLVRVGDRWWISGATVTPDLPGASSPEPAKVAGMREKSEALLSVIEDLREGVFSSAEEAAAAARARTR